MITFGTSVFWATCGDSRVVYYGCAKQEIISSNDHHGSKRSERDRIKQSGGHLTESNRLMGDLMVKKKKILHKKKFYIKKKNRLRDLLVISNLGIMV